MVPLLCALVIVSASASGNMNGDYAVSSVSDIGTCRARVFACADVVSPYPISTLIPSPHTASQSPDPLDTDWKSDYAAKGYEYFDVWAPEIATSYSEAFWTDQV